MRIAVNGDNTDVTSDTLQQVLTECGYHSESIATALNGTFIHRQDRAQTAISEGDQIEVVAPIEGG